VVLQLALAIDYAIILCHRFSDEHETKDARESAIIALSKAIPEIGGSSLTTVSGLAALAFMKFGIGLDMAMVLIKAILLSLLSVFTLMPGLLVLFCPLIDKTRHKKLLPNITFAGKFAVKTRRVVPFLFIILLVGAFFLSSRCPYAYSFTDLKTAKMTDSQTAYFKIKDTFGASNMVAILVPAGDYEAEAEILQTLEGMEEVKSVTGLAGMEVMGGYRLTDALTYAQIAEVLQVDAQMVRLLYSTYAIQNGQVGQLLGGLEQYRIPLIDLAPFVKKAAQANNMELDSMLGEASVLLDQLEMAMGQMQSEKYSRMVMYLNLPEEGEKTFAFLQNARDIIGQHYEGDYYLVGNSTNSRDLSASFAKDNLMITLLSILFVVLVLLFTFRSAGLPVLLIAVIQGSIWINYSFPTLTDTPLYFLGYLIVSAIQMGANIDYAIVISSRYQEKRAEMTPKEAIVAAVNAVFPTVFTSGTMMAAAGLLIGNMSAQPVIAILGTCIGRGTIISMLLVLFVLPSILILGDKFIEATRFGNRKTKALPCKEEKTAEEVAAE
jgi:predicted RND superfamily exporter protein